MKITLKCYCRKVVSCGTFPCKSFGRWSCVHFVWLLTPPVLSLSPRPVPPCPSLSFFCSVYRNAASLSAPRVSVPFLLFFCVSFVFCCSFILFFPFFVSFMLLLSVFFTFVVVCPIYTTMSCLFQLFVVNWNFQLTFLLVLRVSSLLCSCCLLFCFIFHFVTSVALLFPLILYSSSLASSMPLFFPLFCSFCCRQTSFPSYSQVCLITHFAIRAWPSVPRYPRLLGLGMLTDKLADAAGENSKKNTFRRDYR